MSFELSVFIVFLNRRYSITAEDFAALLHQVSPCATGDNTSLFDNVFNKARLFEKATEARWSRLPGERFGPGLSHHSPALERQPGPASDRGLTFFRVVKKTRRNTWVRSSVTCSRCRPFIARHGPRGCSVFRLPNCRRWKNFLGGESISRCLATGNTGRRTFQIRGQKKQISISSWSRIFSYRRAAIRVKLPCLPGQPCEPILHGLPTPRQSKKLDVSLIPESGDEERPWITIDQIQTTDSTSATSLEGQNIKWHGAGFDELTHRKMYEHDPAINPWRRVFNFDWHLFWRDR